MSLVAPMLAGAVVGLVAAVQAGASSPQAVTLPVAILLACGGAAVSWGVMKTRIDKIEQQRTEDAGRVEVQRRETNAKLDDLGKQMEQVRHDSREHADRLTEAFHAMTGQLQDVMATHRESTRHVLAACARIEERDKGAR